MNIIDNTCMDKNDPDCKANNCKLNAARACFGICGDTYFLNDILRSYQFQLDAILKRQQRSIYRVSTQQGINEANALAINFTIITSQLRPVNASGNDV